jgi:(p)ppGpp synthase/HD superfamily hydrolase
MDINSLENDRKEKIRSLLCDRLSLETEALRAELAELALPAIEMNSFNKAFQFALAQDYGSGTLQKYYVSHPIRVARFAATWMKHHKFAHPEMLVAAILHNVLEKDVITKNELLSLAGKWVTDTVETLTVDRIHAEERPWVENYYRAINARDKHTAMLKFFDKFDNLYAICLAADTKIRESYINEIEEFIKPIQASYAPEYSPYFDKLISSSRAMGHRSIETYQKDFAHEKET